jgi:MerR family transcriptional regulator, light-induced transcriptional regulator
MWLLTGRRAGAGSSTRPRQPILRLAALRQECRLARVCAARKGDVPGRAGALSLSRAGRHLPTVEHPPRCDNEHVARPRTSGTLEPRVSTIETLLERYVAAQLEGDRRSALRVVVDEGLARGVPVPRLYVELIQAAQYQIGELWQANRISVAQEHLATAISQLALAELYRALPAATPLQQRVLVACVTGELHDLGARITADFFEMAGFQVRYLGANVPSESLVPMVRDDPPDVLVLSVTMSFHVDVLREAVWRTREVTGDRVHLAVGGQAFTWAPELVGQLGAEIYGRDASESVAAARHLLGVS